MNQTGFEYGPQTYYDDDLNKTLLIVPEDEYTVRKTALIEQQRDYFERKAAIESDTRHYVNCYHDPIRELNEKLAVNELGAVMKLLPYLKMRSNGQLTLEGKRMGVVEIGKVIGKSQRQATELVKALVKADVLTAAKDGRKNVYNVNERYHTIGHTLKDAYYTKLYQTKTRAEISSVSIQSAGVFYKMLPFFHYAKYYLCANPNEEQPDSLRHLTQTDLAEVINVDRGVVKRAISELSRYGFIMISKTFGATVIMVNPDVMFRQRTVNEYTESIRYQFAQAKNCAEQNGVDDDHSWLPF